MAATLCSDNKVVAICFFVCSNQVQHVVSIDTESPSCTQCRIWGNYRIICAHIFLVLRQKRPDLFTEDGKLKLLRIFFHPAYIIDNWTDGMDHQLTAPQPNFGPNKESTEDIIALDSDGEEIDLPTTNLGKAEIVVARKTAGKLDLNDLVIFEGENS